MTRVVLASLFVSACAALSVHATELNLYLATDSGIEDKIVVCPGATLIYTVTGNSRMRSRITLSAGMAIAPLMMMGNMCPLVFSTCCAPGARHPRIRVCCARASFGRFNVDTRVVPG